jgi:hypothetical protein
MICLTTDYKLHYSRSMNIEKVALDSIREYHNNPRQGNTTLIAESLSTYGQYKPITVNKRSGEILAGNHTYRAAKELGWSEIDIVYVDVDETTAAKIVAIDNRSADLGQYDNEKLAALLETLPELDGSGYTLDEFDALIADIQEETTPELSKSAFSQVEVGETGQSGTRYIETLAAYGERYNQRATRMLMADFSPEIYVWLIDKLIFVRNTHNLTSNGDAIVKMAEIISGESAPHESDQNSGSTDTPS